jgi:hypothetical protein
MTIAIMQTKKMSMSKRVYTDGISLRPTKIDNPYHQEDLYLEQLLSGKSKKMHKTGFAQKLYNILHESLNIRTAERNLSLAKSLTKVWQEHSLPELRIQIILCLSLVDHKEATVFLMETHKTAKAKKDSKTQAACIDSLLMHLQIMNEKIQTEEDKTAREKYKKAKLKMEEFFYRAQNSSR